MTTTTELEAVNAMLSALGSQPISSLSGAMSSDASLAKTLLTEVRRDVLLEGWHFNTELEVSVAPNATTGRVSLGSSVVRIDVTTGKNLDVDVVQRGSELYDRKNHTWVFDSDLTCDIVYELDWDQLPEACKRYIQVRAARLLVDRLDGDRAQHVYTAQDEMDALSRLRIHDGETGDRTIFDNWGVGRIVNRSTAFRRFR